MVYLSFNHQLLDSLDLLKILSIIYIKSGLIQIVIEKSKQQLKPPRKNNNYQVSRTTIRQYSFILDLKLIYNTYSKYPNLILHQTLKLFIIKKKNLMLLIKLKSYCMIYLFRTSFFLINLYQNKLPNTKIQKQTKNQQKKFTFYLAYVKIKNQLIIVSLNLEKYKIDNKSMKIQIAKEITTFPKSRKNEKKIN
ncbi:unnamed protein product [Paramecium sonneborni]|uniref:Uncharacterized protein n=1 Tax=Paramecium sonneborni TaxID=65129 RepID=A0A8S1L978_9CILI|nr:unnamed protein product [Paramecium sonneborni]